MSEKHTPGPGEIDYAGNAWFEATKANARLIAAAPELLDQLRFAVALLKPIFGQTPQVESMETAIAKAIG